MAKDPAFLFYPNDWLGGTLGMTFEEKGAYMELLMLQFNRGHMTKDMIGQTVGQLWVKLQDKFRQDSKGLWYNERLDLEKEKRKNFVSSRRNNKNGKNQHSKNEGHMTSHMENENRNENVIDNKKEPISKLEIFEAIFTDDIFIGNLQMAHRGKDLKQAWEECWIHHSNAGSPPGNVGEWKQKLNTWLSNTKINGTSKTKREQNSSAIREAIANDILREHGSG
jgi:uncharacterized protein YdaU (DUF1376 family)